MVTCELKEDILTVTRNKRIEGPGGVILLGIEYIRDRMDKSKRLETSCI
jgi:hypothetical protein